jgi:hypothetical protein
VNILKANPLFYMLMRVSQYFDGAFQWIEVTGFNVPKW